MLDEAEQKLFAVSQKYIKAGFRSDQVHSRIGFQTVSMSFIRATMPSAASRPIFRISTVCSPDSKIRPPHPRRPPEYRKDHLCARYRPPGRCLFQGPSRHLLLEMGSDQLIDRTAPPRLVSISGVSAPENSRAMVRETILNASPTPWVSSPKRRSSSMIPDRSISWKCAPWPATQAEHNLGLIIIDYLQLMEGRSRGGDNRVQEISEISPRPEAARPELDIPVIALSPAFAPSNPDQIGS